jgi:hypothetical protein
MKSDKVSKPIAAELRKAGAVVQFIEGPRGQKGVPDLLVGFGGRTFLLECKDPETGRISPGQLIWHAQWAGAPVAVVSSVVEALIAIGLAP